MLWLQAFIAVTKARGPRGPRRGHAYGDPAGQSQESATAGDQADRALRAVNLPYDPATDFVPLMLAAQSPFVLMVNSEPPVKSVQEFVAYAKANPGKLATSSALT
jgi:tripartite-type tricarboxylate transporter receptor subunit TctC